MPNLIWTSCTGPVDSPLQLVANLRDGCPTKQQITPLSDLRFVLCCCLVYLAIVALLGSIYNKNGASFASNIWFIRLASAHNIFLSFASLVMNIGVSIAIFNASKFEGITATMCTWRDRQPPVIPNELQFWLYVFYVSKFYELFDTVLLILRGKPLTLLHVWHHTTVMLESWAFLEFGVTISVYGMWFNTFVHVFMYAYYAAALLRVQFPMKKLITMTQIVQFITGFCSLVPFTYYNSQRTGCTGAWGLAIAGCINASYLILFVQFFRRAYTTKSLKRKMTSFASKIKKLA